jgi:hypothetical protein
MAQKTYIVTHDFNAPYVRVTGIPHKPQEIKAKRFRKGDIIKGELKHANNKPAFILVGSGCIVPLDVVRELTTKAIGGTTPTKGKTSSFDGVPKTKKVSVPTNPKVRYADAMVIGAIIGVAAVFVAEKQGFIGEPDKKYKLYGAIGGALLGAYLVYRTSNAKPKVQIVNQQDLI